MAARSRWSIDSASLALVALTAFSTSVLSQSGTGATAHKHEATPPPKSGSHSNHANDAAADPTQAVHEAMSGALTANPHMRLSPLRVATHADSVRAEQVVATTRAALARYRDVRVAERAGYRMFAPNVKNQPVYHFTKLGAAVRERFRFDPTQPSSLLYRKASDGSLRRVGAMYTAPRDAT